MNSDEMKRAAEIAKQLQNPETKAAMSTIGLLGSDALKKAVADAGLHSMMRQHYEIPKMPDISSQFKNLKIKPLSEYHEENSASNLLAALEEYYQDWSATLSEDKIVTIYAFLPSGAMVRVKNIKQEGQNGVTVEGTINGADCLFMMHQASFQFICLAEESEPEAPKRTVGFHTFKSTE